MRIVDRIGLFADRVGLSADRAGHLRLLIYTATVYAAWAFLYPGRTARLERHLFSWLGVMVLVFLYWQGHRQLRTLDRGRGRFIGLGALVIAAAALPAPAFQSSDIYAYVNCGWIQHEYGLNPYASVPADVTEFQDDAMLDARWSETPCSYGFLFAHLTRAVAWAGAGDPQATLLLFKLLNVALILLLGRLIWTTSRQLDLARPDLAVYAFTWSPLIVLHFVANGHNDLWMALFVVLSFRAALHGQWMWVVPMLTAGVLIKHVAAVALPFAAIHLLRKHGGRRTAASFGLAVAMAAMISIPYLRDWQDIRWLEIGDTLTTPWNSFQAALSYAWAALARAVPTLGPSAGSVTLSLRALFMLGYLGFFATLIVKASRRARYDARAFLEDVLTALFVLLCVASAAFHPWYLGMFFPAVFLLSPGHRLRRLSVWLSMSLMLFFTGVAKARVLEAVLTLGLPMWWFHRRRPEEVCDALSENPRRDAGEGR